jgi:hypothetical protein
MSIEAMKQALEVLEDARDGTRIEYNDHSAYQDEITSLRQAIEQAEKQEPVAYKYTDKTNPLVFYFTTHKDSLPNPDVIEAALYTAPPKREWVGLTIDDYPPMRGGDHVFLAGYQYAEAKLREKNNG